MIDRIETGLRIAALRKKLGCSQTEFAGHLSVTPQAVSKWETGASLPDVEILLTMSWMFDVTVNELLSGNGLITGDAAAERSMKLFASLSKCPKCGEKLDAGQELRCKNSHRFGIIDGVAFFNSREIDGELWSLYLKNYDEYLREATYEFDDERGGKDRLREALRREIARVRPRVLLDVASGTGHGVKRFLHTVSWPATLILADLSHRILKYDKIFFESRAKNPYVDVACVACDCADIPVAPGSVDLVHSSVGFESMQRKAEQGFEEAHRVLKPGGHVLFNTCVAEDFEGENSKKWLTLLRESVGEKVFKEDFFINDFKSWQDRCARLGYDDFRAEKIHGEMPAPESGGFPFENNMLRWMAGYVISARKAR